MSWWWLAVLAVGAVAGVVTHDGARRLRREAVTVDASRRALAAATAATVAARPGRAPALGPAAGPADR